LGTAFYHASLTFVGQTFDIMGMYLLATFIVLYNASRLTGMSPRWFVALYVLANAALVSLVVEVPSLRRYIFAVLLLTAVGIEVRAWKQGMAGRKALIVGVITLFAMGWGIWILDITGVLCSPDGLFQGHAVWHFAGAIASGMLYVYYRGEPMSNESAGN
jgi:hypothetical protein